LTKPQPTPSAGSITARDEAAPSAAAVMGETDEIRRELRKIILEELHAALAA
jgi:hypothetical protein